MNLKRVCTICGEEKFQSAFFPAKRAKSGFHAACKKCHTDQVRYWRNKNPLKWKKISTSYSKKNWKKYRESVSIWRKKTHQELKGIVYDHYKPICACCKEKEFKFLSIDHINNDGAEERRRIFGRERAGSGTAYYKWVITNNFPSNLQILCMNCNYGKARNKGICPHKILNN